MNSAFVDTKEECGTLRIHVRLGVIWRYDTFLGDVRRLMSEAEIDFLKLHRNDLQNEIFEERFAFDDRGIIGDELRARGFLKDRTQSPQVYGTRRAAQSEARTASARLTDGIGFGSFVLLAVVQLNDALWSHDPAKQQKALTNTALLLGAAGIPTVGRYLAQMAATDAGASALKAGQSQARSEMD